METSPTLQEAAEAAMEASMKQQHESAVLAAAHEMSQQAQDETDACVDIATRLSLLRANDPKLALLTLNQLDCTADGLFDALKGNSVLSVLNMWGSHLTAANMACFVDAISGNRSLTNLSVGKVRP